MRQGTLYDETALFIPGEHELSHFSTYHPPSIEARSSFGKAPRCLSSSQSEPPLHTRGVELVDRRPDQLVCVDEGSFNERRR